VHVESARYFGDIPPLMVARQIQGCVSITIAALLRVIEWWTRSMTRGLVLIAVIVLLVWWPL
jgi:hypothetical protein